LCKIFVALNLSFQIIENEHFQQLLQMLRSEITLVHRTKLSSMIFLKYDEIHAKIKQDLKELRQIFIMLNAWSSFQKVAYLRVLIYWMNATFQYHEHFIEFTSLQVEHTDYHLMQKLFKILNIYNIKNKFFDVVIDNASNNDTLKKKFERVLSWRDILWDKAQNLISCMTHIINLMTQEFIKVIESKTLNNNLVVSLNDYQVENVITSNDFCTVIMKIFIKLIMQKDNAFTNQWNRFMLLLLSSIVLFNESFAF